jgi:hypothetical protein
MTLTIQAGKYYRTRDGRKVGPIKNLDDKVYPFCDDSETYTKLGEVIDGKERLGDLIAEWQDETPAHIIQSSNGRTYDLTQNEIRNDLLPDDVLQALKNWPHGIERRTIGIGWKVEADETFNDWGGFTYRAKPAQQVREYVLYWVADESPSFIRRPYHTHRITIRDDGTGKLTAEVEALK